MILYDLICEKDHEFESWFRNSNAVEKLIKAGQVICPVCESTKVKKALQAPNIPRKSALKTTPEKPKGKKAKEVAAAVEKMTQALAELRDTIEKNFDNVGDKFPEEARKLHYKEKKSDRGIYGNASPKEAKDLVDEGINVFVVPVSGKSKKRTDS
jgi:hypothetical protein